MFRDRRRGLDDARHAWRNGERFDASFAEPAPSLDVLRELGIPAVEDEAFLARVHDERKLRRFLARLLRDDGWEWAELGRRD